MVYQCHGESIGALCSVLDEAALNRRHYNASGTPIRDARSVKSLYLNVAAGRG